MVRIGIIGGGRISGAHAAAVSALASTALAGIAEVQEERLRAFTETWGCPGFADYRDLLAREDVDGAIVALPHHLHTEVTVACLSAGKAVMLEKPMAMTVAECDRILSARDASGSLLMVGHTHHFRPANVEARRLIAAGAIGEPFLLTDTWYKPFWADPRPAWFLEAASGGGMWAMNGSHMIDRLMLFTGSRVTAVKARVGSPVFGLSAADSGAAYLDFATGATGQISHSGYRDGVERFEAEVTGPEGQVRVLGGGDGGSGLFLSRGGEWTPVEVPLPSLAWRPGAPGVHLPIAAEIAEFAAAVRDGRPPAVTGEYAREVVRVMVACEESTVSGREVRLD